jgi:hypothetical protein
MTPSRKTAPGLGSTPAVRDAVPHPRDSTRDRLPESPSDTASGVPRTEPDGTLRGRPVSNGFGRRARVNPIRRNGKVRMPRSQRMGSIQDPPLQLHG